ncbi:hypothetical protein [Nostoc sp. NZL]|uniref:hypothetical protein n=1 Tax=Nostoc sp. NZL TaxID=2650612 RepID=UPI0018C76528|nr:hypothetical protein [Nostoc sp. NZL]
MANTKYNANKNFAYLRLIEKPRVYIMSDQISVFAIACSQHYRRRSHRLTRN